MIRIASRLSVVLPLILYATLQHAPAIAHAAGLRTVALTGQQAPGTPGGVIYDSFGHDHTNLSAYHGISLNDAGQIAFRANLAGDGVDFTNNQGVWSEGSGSVALVTRTGSQAPGASAGVNFRIDPAAEVFLPVLNDAGQTAFYGATTDGGLGLWSEGSGSLTAVARSGDHAPGTPSGVNFDFDGLVETPLLNNAGRTTFRSYLSGAGVTSDNEFGVWSEGPGGLELRARRGSQAPGLPAGVNHGYTCCTGLNDAGQIAFASLLSGSGVNSSNDKGVWSDVSGSLSPVARKGSQAPGLPSGVTFDELFNTGSINNAGQIAFGAGLSNQGSMYKQDSVWLYNAGSVTPLLVRGEHPPGTPAGVTYELFGFWPVLNEAGQVLTGVLLAGSGVDASNELAVYLSDAAGNENLILRSGDQAPDAPAGVVFNATRESFAEGELNDRGQVAIGLKLAGAGVDVSNDFGIWATDSTGALRLIAREGDQLEVAPGDFRTISELNRTYHTANSNGWPSAFNNFGQFAFWASFTDGSQGVFVSNAVANMPGDFNNDGAVDAADYVVWRKNSSGDQAMYDAWRANFGTSLGPGSGAALPSAAPLSAAVPEPSTLALLVIASALRSYRQRGRQNSHGFASPPTSVAVPTR
jgi:hypothetical protein